MKVVQYWSHAPRATINGTREKSFVGSTKNTDNKKKKTKAVSKFFVLHANAKITQQEKIFCEKIIKTQFKLMKSKATLINSDKVYLMIVKRLSDGFEIYSIFKGSMLNFLRNNLNDFREF